MTGMSGIDRHVTPPHRTTSWKLPVLIAFVLLLFGGVIRAIERLPNPGYSERTGAIDVTIEPAEGTAARAIQVRSRCGGEVVDTFTLSAADFPDGPIVRPLETSASGDCFLGVRALPSAGDFVEARLEGCRVLQSPELSLDCQAKGTTPSSQ